MGVGEQGPIPVNIWRDVTYDELTINECQKKDAKFSAILDSVRCGCPTAETIGTLQEWLVQGSIADKFLELREHGQPPVCLFPTRKACNDFNSEMIGRLSSEVHELPCTDEVDEHVTHVNGPKNS